MKVVVLRLKAIIKHPIFQWVFWVAFGIIVMPSLILSIGVFGYKGLAVASNSMKPLFSKGDMIIVKKLSEEDKDNLKIGDIIRFKVATKVDVIHEIVWIENMADDKVYITKGKNNAEQDKWLVRDDIILSIYQFRVPYLAWPSVLLMKLGYFKFVLISAFTLWLIFRKRKERKLDERD